MDDSAIEQQFRGAMRRLASGVALVTTAGADGRPFGIAMTAFMSLSMEPPAMLLAINRNASLCDPLLKQGRFAVNILDRQQGEQCQAFVAAPVTERFSVLSWDMADDGIPRLNGALATVVCSVGHADLFGSHMVVQGLVEAVNLSDGIDPLIYLDGRYGGAALQS